MSEQVGDDDTYGIKILERRYEDAKNKLAEITQTLELKEKSDAIVRVLALAQTKARNGISKEICVEANQRIHDLMPNNAIRIEKVDRCLILQGQEGGSVGETLSVAYAFLATLFNRTEHELPFIVDSPDARRDVEARSANTSGTAWLEVLDEVHQLTKFCRRSRREIRENQVAETTHGQRFPYPKCSTV